MDGIARVVPALMGAVMMILYIGVFVYFFVLFHRLVRAVEWIAKKLEDSTKLCFVICCGRKRCARKIKRR